MVRSLAEEEEEGACTGSGSMRGTARYAVGDEVEVIFTESGFRGARFEATVAAQLPSSGGYEVVFSTLLAHRRGPPLREIVAAADLRPRPPPAAGRDFELYDLVEAFHSDGWWPGVVSSIRTTRTRGARYTVSLPLFREAVALPASLVRPRREFVRGRWMDAQEVMRGVPLYPEGSSVEVMWDEEKQGRSWMPATITKMIGCTNYVVSYGNGATEVLHSCFIRPQPIFDKMEFELKPSAEVEVYKDGVWSLGVIAHIGSCQPRTYRVRVKHHGSGDHDYFLVSSASLRPYSKWGGLESRPFATKKHAREHYSPDLSTSDGDSDQYYSYSDSDYSPSMDSDEYSSHYSRELFTSGGDREHHSSVPNRRVKKENMGKDELLLGNLILDAARSSPKDVMDMEILYEKDDAGVKKLENENEGLGFRAANGEAQILEVSTRQKLICTKHDSKGTSFLSKELSVKRKDLHSVSPGEIVKQGSKSNYFDVVVISDDSGCRNFIEIDSSSSNPNRKKKRMNLPDKEPHSITEVDSWMADTCNGEDICLINSNQKTVNQTYGGAFPIGKLEPSSNVPKDANADYLCIEVSKENKMEKQNEITGMSPKEDAFSIGKLEPSSSGQQDVKADLLCIEGSKDNEMEAENEIICMSGKGAAVFPLETYVNSKGISDISLAQRNASWQHPLGQLQLPVSREEAGSSFLHPGVMVDLSSLRPLPAPNTCILPPVFSTSSLLLMPDHKMEVFQRLQQRPHFREVWDCPPEFREGKALGLMVSFANMAESIKNMRIQDEAQVYQEKMSSLLDLEENGFDVGPLKVRLDNLLHMRNHQIHLMSRKASLEKEILVIEVENCALEQRLKILDMCIMGLDEKRFWDMKASLETQKVARCSSISKLQVDLRLVEESLMSTEADFDSIASAPW